MGVAEAAFGSTGFFQHMEEGEDYLFPSPPFHFPFSLQLSYSKGFS